MTITYGQVLDAASPLPWAEMKAGGFLGGIRYVGGDYTITADEAAQAAASGLGLALVYEDEPNSFLGAQQGVQRAQIVRPLLEDLGWPAGRPVYASIDTDLSVSDYPQTWLGIQAFAADLGRPAACYGPRAFLAWLASVQGVTFLWQSAGWTTGPGTPQLTLEQVLSINRTVYGVTVDIDVVYAADWGQNTFKPPVPVPKPEPQEEDDMKQFVAVATDASAADKLFPAVAKGSTWVVAPPFCRSWLATTADVKAACAQLGQTEPVPLSANTLNRLPITGRHLAGTEITN